MLRQKQKESELVSARLSPKELEEIERLVDEGFYMNTADFVRTAVREKLESVKIIDVRDVTKDKAKKEIIDYLKRHQEAYASEISEKLGLDLELVFLVMKELKKEGVVE